MKNFFFTSRICKRCLTWKFYGTKININSIFIWSWFIFRSVRACFGAIKLLISLFWLKINMSDFVWIIMHRQSITETEWYEAQSGAESLGSQKLFTNMHKLGEDLMIIECSLSTKLRFAMKSNLLKWARPWVNQHCRELYHGLHTCIITATFSENLFQFCLLLLLSSINRT